MARPIVQCFFHYSTNPVRGVKFLGWKPLGLALKFVKPLLSLRGCSPPGTIGWDRKSSALPDSTERGDVGVWSTEFRGDDQPLGFEL